MKFYELANTCDDKEFQSGKRYHFLNLHMAKLFQKANPEYSIAERDTLDEISNETK